jgi:FtsZ-binding cell division protein ZapB
MDDNTIEIISAIVAGVGVMMITAYRILSGSKLAATEDDESIVSQQLEVNTIQTGMLNRLLAQVETNNALIVKMQTELDELKKRNADLETSNINQAEQIDKLRARVAQLEHELRRNDLSIPDPIHDTGAPDE